MSNTHAQELIGAAEKLLLQNYRQSPIVMSRGEGCVLWDTEGRRYLDMTAGIAVCALGHGHRGLADAIASQASRLIHTSNLYYVETQVLFAEALAKRAFAGRAFFCNSGAEANEAALKIARRYQVTCKQQPNRTEIIAFEGSFHGRTMGALSVTGQTKYREGFGPLVPGVTFVPYGNLDAVKVHLGPNTCAVIVEPIAAEGGILVPPPGYLLQLRQACDAAGALLIFDEVQTGVGRTGTFYAFEQENMVPDVITLAKGIAGGVPMGAMLASPEVSRAFEPGVHASTFGGNPLASAAALYVQHAIDDLGLLQNVQAMGAYLNGELARLAAAHYPKTTAARGRGLLQGLVMAGDAAPIVAQARERGLLLSVAGGKVVRFVPALLVTKAEIDEAVGILNAVLSAAS
ncbi:MAG: aspartate aminotransferase family protein [Deltaproteobacteria bacterium]|nr:aspartate aminotransferase family protein [Deltaproteobacteria bacterium]